MRKFVVLFMVAIMFLLSGCPGGEEEKSNDNKMQVKKIETKSAREFMDNYMRYMLRGDTLALKSFLSTKAKSSMKSNLPEVSEPHPVGYKLEEGEDNQDKMEISAHIYKSKTGVPYFSDDTFKYTLILQGGKILIDKIEQDKSMEIYAEGKTLYSREGDKIQGQPILSLADMPNYMVPKGAGEQKFPVPRDSFGPCAISPDDKSIIVTTGGQDSFIAIIKQKEGDEQAKASSAQEGGSQGGGKGGDKGGKGGGQGGQEGQDQGGSGGQNQQAKITLKPVDMHFKSRVNTISFSEDGKHFAVELVPGDGMNQVLIYKGEEGEVVKTSIEKQFRPGRFSVTSPYFISSDAMVINVVPAKNATPEEQMLKGEWVLNLKTNKLKHNE